MAEDFKKAIKEGKIDINKLVEMDSVSRRAFFQDMFGERSGIEVNALFESKLLLKSQKRGLVNWAKQITGIKESARQDLITRIEKMDRILNPVNEKAFLQDLANKRLGTEITLEEAKNINELSDKVAETKNFTDEKGRIEHGLAKIELSDYVNGLKGVNKSVLTNILNIPRATMTTLDLSAALNQGWGMMSRPQFWKSVPDMIRYAAKESNYKKLRADLITRPRYELAKKSGLRLTELGDKLEMREEAFMTTLLDRIPGAKGSQRAYTGFLNKLRMDVYDQLIGIAEKRGEDVGVGSKGAKDIADVVNNFTGGARLGSAEMGAAWLNNVFFSPRKIVSTLQVFNPLNYLDPKISKTARLAATRNLLGSIAMTMTIIKLSELLTGEKQENDPRSTNFGKIKIGNKRLDLTGGNGTYATLIARLLKQSTKTSKGDIRELGSGYGQTSGYNLLSQNIRYKFSPVASLIVDTLSGSNAIGEKKTISQSVKDRMKPMFANSTIELLSDAEKRGGVELSDIVFIIGALFGGGLSTYDVNESTTKKSTKTPDLFKQK